MGNKCSIIYLSQSCPQLRLLHEHQSLQVHQGLFCFVLKVYPERDWRCPLTMDERQNKLRIGTNHVFWTHFLSLHEKKKKPNVFFSFYQKHCNTDSIAWYLVSTLAERGHVNCEAVIQLNPHMRSRFNPRRRSTRIRLRIYILPRCIAVRNPFNLRSIFRCYKILPH